jgi:hypothetical protein
MKTYTVTSKSPRPRNLYHFQGKNAKRDAERYLARYIRETGDTTARITTEITP